MQTIILIDILCIGCQYRYRFLITFQLLINTVNQLRTYQLLQINLESYQLYCWALRFLDKFTFYAIMEVVV